MLVDNFIPHWLVSSGFIQSIACILWPQIRTPGGLSSRFLVPIGDDGHLSVIQNIPTNWGPERRIVLIVHGLTGSEDSTHSVRLAHAFVKRGVMAFRMNMRGCGPGEGLARGIYHSGRSEDTRAVLEWISSKFPNSQITQIGISLGGNATLKMAGEYGSSRPAFLQGVAAVCAPIDLAACSQLISAPHNRIFDLYFARRLINHVRMQNKRFPDKIPALPVELLHGRQSLARFDDLYVAPTSGFKSGRHYYEVCSSLPLLDSISCPALMLAADDDPIVPVITYQKIRKRRGMDVIVTKRGGHTAFISNRLDPEYGRFWMDRVVVDWVMGLG